MGCENVTLDDIAKATGFSKASVHRAIYNKDGISEETRQKILSAVDSLGYEMNYLASSLKRKALTFAYVGKKPSSSDDYHNMMLEGARAAFRQFEGMNIFWKEFLFDGEGVSLEGSECELLESIFRMDDINGLVVFPINTGMKLMLSIQKLIGKGIPVVFVDDYFEDLDYIGSVSPYYFSVGSTSAEFLSKVTRPGKILVSLGSGNSKGSYQNYEGFEAFLNDHCPGFSCQAIEDSFDKEGLIQEIVSQLDDSVVGLYSVCETNTPVICEARIRSGRDDIHLLGSELSSKNRKYLEDGILDGVVDMNSYQQGYVAIRVLLENVLKGASPSFRNMAVPVSIVLKSNLQFFGNNREYGIAISNHSDFS